MTMRELTPSKQSIARPLADGRVDVRERVQDLAFLGLAVVLSLLLYIRGLGFYSDDWGFLMLLHESPSQSPVGLFRALYAGDVVIRQRPIQVAYLSGLYWLLGLHPLGYHLVNGAVLLANALLIYLVLRSLQLPRYLALSVPLVYALLPGYSTDRFWVAAFQAPLSISLYLLGLYTQLRAPDSRRPAVWYALSAVFLAGSGMAYEVTLPLFLLNPFVIWYARRRGVGQRLERRGTGWGVAPVLWATVIPFLAVVAFKLVVTVRLNAGHDYVGHMLQVYAGALRVNYGVYGLALPYVLWWITRHALDWRVMAAAALLGALTMAYVYRSMKAFDLGEYGRSFWLRFILAGLAIFGLGYAVFLVNSDITFESTSLANRVAIAAALGVAITFVGGTGLLSVLLPAGRLRRLVFSLLIAMAVASGLVITNTLARFWDQAYQQQRAIMQDVEQHVAPLPAHGVLLLNGVCMQHGGAYSFTGQRDLAALLILASGDHTVDAKALSNKPKVQVDGVVVYTQRESVLYPYSQNLLLYDYLQKQVYRLPDVEAAQRYFAQANFDPVRDCPPMFAWGSNS